MTEYIYYGTYTRDGYKDRPAAFSSTLKGAIQGCEVFAGLLWKPSEEEWEQKSIDHLSTAYNDYRELWEFKRGDNLLLQVYKIGIK